MATATTIKGEVIIHPDKIRLELLNHEAQFLIDLANQCAGNPSLSRRKIADEIIEALKTQNFVPDRSGPYYRPKDLDQREYTGGTIFWLDV